jgi:hypothetical protein
MGNANITRRRFLQIATVAGAQVLAGCGGAPAAQPATPQAAQSSGAAASTPATTSAIKYADAACVHRHIKGGFIAPGPDDGMIKQLQEEALRKEYGLNIDLRFESAAWSDIDQLITTRLETKGTDSVERDGTSALGWMSQEGLLQDMEDEIVQYGHDLEKFYPKAAFDYFNRDGKRFAIANFYSTPVDAEYIHIRRDWLDKIDRDIPQTIEDLEECLRLFKDKKLGGDVTVPVSPDLGGWLIPSYVLTGPFAPEPAEQLSLMKAGQDFEYEYGCAMRPERLELLQRWHKDGLLNPEWASLKGEDHDSLVDKGAVGCQLGVWGALNGRLQRVERDIDQKQDWVQIYPPVGLKGKPDTARILTEIPLERAVVVTSWSACAEAIVAFTDWVNKSFENYMLSFRGIEGKHWKFADNGAYVDLRTPEPNAEYSGMRGIVWSPIWQNKFQQLPAAPGKEPKDPMINKRIFGPHLYNRVDTTKPQQGEYPTLTRLYHFVAWNFKESAKFEPDLLALRNESATKIIKGELGVTDGLKTFWEQWRARGGEARLKEIADQYDVYIKNNPAMSDPKVFFAPESWNREVKYPERKK